MFESVAPQLVAAEVVVVPEIASKPIELSHRNSHVPTSRGVPKSKKPWKISSERSGKHTPYAPKSWQQKMDYKKKLQSIRDRVKEAKDDRKAHVNICNYKNDYRDEQSRRD